MGITNNLVIPAKAGIQSNIKRLAQQGQTLNTYLIKPLDSRLRGNDERLGLEVSGA